MADNSPQSGTDTIRDKDRAGVKTQVVGLDANINGAELLGTGTAVGTKNAVDMNIAGSDSGVAAATGTLSATAADAQGTQSIVTTSALVVADVRLAASVKVQVVISAFVGGYVFEGSGNGGFNYAPMTAKRIDGGGQVQSEAWNQGTPLSRIYSLDVANLTHVRVRCSAFTSGGAVVTINQGPMQADPVPSLGASATLIGLVKQMTAGTSTITSVAAQTTPATIINTNTARLGASVYNDSTATMYLLVGTQTPSTTNYTVQVPPGGYYEFPPGITVTTTASAVWSAANGSARVTEWTA